MVMEKQGDKSYVYNRLYFYYPSYTTPLNFNN